MSIMVFLSINQIPTEGHSVKYLGVLFKSVKIIQNKEGLRKHQEHREDK